MMNKIINVIKESKSFLITSHKSPDGDAIGSCIALGIALKQLGKKVSYVIETPVQSKFEYMHEINCFEKLPYNSFDVALFLDCSDVSHLYNPGVLDNCNTSINLDHHISNNSYCDFNYIDSTASATGEIIYDVINKLDTTINKDIAVALYTSIVTDTGNFKYSNVTSKTHKIVSELYHYPNDYAEINRKIFDENTYGKIKLLGKALNNLFLTKEGKVSIIHLSMNDYIDKHIDDEGIINYARDIQGVEVAIGLKEIQHKTYKISFRSTKDFDVSKLATIYGGGGHQKASGCVIEGYTKDEIINEIISRINI